MAVFFDSNAAFSPVSLHGRIQSSNNTNFEVIRDVARYQLLYQNMLNRMLQYINLYTEGSYKELKTVFTTEKLNALLLTNNDSVYYNMNIEELVDFTYDPNIFPQYKRSMYAMLTGFGLSIKQSDDLVSTTAELNEKKDLLTSKDKLIEYITTEFKDKITMDAFYITQPFNVNVELKPWFNLYLQLYGAPYDGVFDAEKLANVVETLVNSNVITAEDFMRGYL